MSEEKPSKNPFINAARKAAQSTKYPEAKTAQVQQAKFKPAVMAGKPVKKAAGRGR